MFERSVADRLRRGTRPLFLLLLTLAAAGAVRAAVPRASATAPASDPIVARVENKPIRLSEVQNLKRRSQDRYQKETGRAAPGAFDTFFMRVGLEEAVRMRLVELDARAKGISVTDAEAETVMKQDPFFKGDAAKFEAYRKQNPQSFADAREQARSQLLFQRRMQGIERELAPSATEIARLARSKDVKARVRYVLVSDIHYDGVHDPTDEELRAFYEKEKGELSRPAELAFTAATLPLPGPEGAIATRARAAELLAAATAGAPFDSLLRTPGVVATSGVWRPGATAGLFARNAGLAQDALKLPAGAIVPGVIESGDAVAIARVDRTSNGSTPTLAQIAVDLRARWRANQIQAEETNAARAYYDAHPDSFTTDAWSVRWARVDSSQVVAREPKESELMAWYEGHRAEFARLDPSGGGIQTRAYAEVKEQVARRWRAEQRALEARRVADALATAWAKGKSGPNSRAIVASGGPSWLVAGGALPDGMPRVLADSARSWDAAPRALVVAEPSGFAVVGLVRHEPHWKTGFDVVEPRARDLAFNQRVLAERQAARDWFEGHRDHFTTGPGYSIAWVLSPPPPPATVDVPATQIERYYRDHLSELGTPPEVHVRHILVATDKRSDAEARALATKYLTRLRNGENFQQLARAVSDDGGNKADGGDLGFVKRGATVPSFERAAFALTAAQPLSNLVRTQFGYHLIQLVERREGKAPAFEDVRVDIAQTLSAQLADTLARMRAEQMLHDSKGFDDMLAKSDQRKLPNQFTRWYEGQALNGPAVIDELRADAPNVAPKAMFPRVYKYLKLGYGVAALDSVMPPRQLTFEESQDRALQEKQRERGIAAAKARADRIEKDLRAGVPWEKAIETAGGETETQFLPRGVGLPTLGPVEGLDAALFGPGADTLAAGGWKRIQTPRGDLFVQLIERAAPEAAQDAASRQATATTVLNRRMYDYIERLRDKYAVKVLRADLAERLPPPPEI
jgi:parvulin-like peptidyl-prolyl isomerase